MRTDLSKLLILLKSSLPTALTLLLVSTPVTSWAWGAREHRIVGEASLRHLDDQALETVQDILGDTNRETLHASCNWPDVVRETPEWNWSSPLHYVNIPRHSDHYVRQRDCSDGLCVTEAILKYANVLTRVETSEEERWQALAWLCHLVGDLHQPLHAGFADDRGANLVDVSYRGEEMDLHEFWDAGLGGSRIPDDDWLPPTVGDKPAIPDTWNPAHVAQWTSDSHHLAATAAYPPAKQIDEDFADKSWEIAKRQIALAAVRLAAILNATLGSAEID